MTRVVFLFGIFLLLFACSKEIPTGHWVSIEYFEGKPYRTLDFAGDTALHVNAHCIPCNGYELILTRHVGDTLEYSIGYEYSENYVINIDTIKKIRSYPDRGESKYVRIDNSKINSRDLFSPLSIKIDLKSSDQVQMEHFRPSLICHLAVGRILENYYDDGEQASIVTNARIACDSSIIQVDDVFIPAEGIPEWIRTQQDLLAESDRRKLIVCLNLDKQTPIELRDKIIAQIELVGDSLRILETFYNIREEKPVFLPIVR